MREENNTELKAILKILGPGTSLREGIENILRAKTGGLVVIGDNGVEKYAGAPKVLEYVNEKVFS